MTVQYTNRRGQTFYLHQGAPCAGRPNYYFSLSAEGNPVDAVPDGYEVYEHPSGAERSLAELLEEAAGGRHIDIPAIVTRGRRLTPEFRLKLIDEERRLFQAERYCYLGSIDDWIPIGRLGRLRDLVRTYAQHLGKESWFDLI